MKSTKIILKSVERKEAKKYAETVSIIRQRYEVTTEQEHTLHLLNEGIKCGFFLSRTLTLVHLKEKIIREVNFFKF